jgi:hypothetical protein
VQETGAAPTSGAGGKGYVDERFPPEVNQHYERSTRNGTTNSFLHEFGRSAHERGRSLRHHQGKHDRDGDAEVNILATVASDDLRSAAAAPAELVAAGQHLHLAIATWRGRRRCDHALARAGGRGPLLQGRVLRWLGCDDTRVPLDKAGIDRLVGAAGSEAGLVFAPWGEDTHQDHRHTSAIVRSATRYTPNVLFYEVPSTIDFLPDVFMNTPNRLGDKFHLLELITRCSRRMWGFGVIDCAHAGTSAATRRAQAAEGFKALRCG